MKEYTINIEGMTCGGCAKSIEKALKAKTGVENVAVDLASKKALIQANESQVSIEQLIEIIEDAGFDATA